MLERKRTFAYLQMMVSLHRLVQKIPDQVVASALIQETCMTMIRMRALESVGNGCDPLMLNPFSDENMASTAEAAAAASTSSSSAPSAAVSEFVANIQASIAKTESIRKSKSSWLFKVLPGLQSSKDAAIEEDIDPEVAATTYKTAEELKRMQHSHDQPFTLRNLAYQLKLFRHSIEPLIAFVALVRRVRDWENPLVTLSTIMILLNMAYRDLLMYLPAIIVLINIGIVAALKYWPNFLSVALGAAYGNGPGEEDGQHQPSPSAAHAASLVDDGEGLSPESRQIIQDGGKHTSPDPTRTASSSTSPSKSTASTSSSSSSSSTAVVAQPASASSSASSSKKEDAGLLARLKNYRDVAVRTRDYLHSVQNSLGEKNVTFMKIEGLYKWRSPDVTQKYFLMLCAAFLVLTFIPFRFIFPILVLDFFTSKWQGAGSIERLLDEVALPAHMPELD